MEFGSQWTNLKYSLLKSPHQLQACTKNLPNMKNVAPKTTNFHQNFGCIEDPGSITKTFTKNY